MSFHVGQNVICVDADDTNSHGAPELTKGATYIVRWCGDHFDEISVRLVGVGRPHLLARWSDFPFRASRFRPLIERKTDISIFNKIARDESERSPARIGEDA